MGKSSIFLNNKVENFKNLEILQSQRSFFKIFQIEIFFMCSILGILQENKESNSHRLIQKP